MYHNTFTKRLAQRIREQRRFLQIVSGPRQVGKSTAIQQALATLPFPHHYVGTNDIAPRSAAGVEWHWEGARHLLRDSGGPVVLAFDDVTTVPGWAEAVSRLWDEDSAAARDIRVVTSASAASLSASALLALLPGRFDLVAMTPWSWPECQAAFDWNVDTYVFNGGFPGGAPLVDDSTAWQAYILGQVVEPTIHQDLLPTVRIDRPESFRLLFSIACASSGQEVSFERLTGLLADVGNTTTVARYLDVLGRAGLVSGLQKYGGGAARHRRSKPKLLAHDPAFVSAAAGQAFEAARLDPHAWRRRTLAAVGARLLRDAAAAGGAVTFWRTRLRGEAAGVDFVLTSGAHPTAVSLQDDVSGDARPGLEAFRRAFGPGAATVLIGPGGVPLDTFLAG